MSELEKSKTKGVYLVHELMELPIEASPYCVQKTQYMIGFYVGTSFRVWCRCKTLETAINAYESLTKEFSDRRFEIFEHTIQTKLLTN